MRYGFKKDYLCTKPYEKDHCKDNVFGYCQKDGKCEFKEKLRPE